MSIRHRFLVFALAALVLPMAHALEQAPFFKQSFLNLQDDLQEAREAGKILMLVYEQEGCPYCAKMHKYIFTDEEVARLLTERFDAVQLDIWGSREVIGFSGEPYTESGFARALGIQFSPMIVFYGPQKEEIFRMAGFYKPERFKAALHYVESGAYHTMSFAAYSRATTRTGGQRVAAAPGIFVASDSLKALGVEAAKAGKGVAVLIEQADCADCVEMHHSHLKDAATARLLTEHFLTTRLDLWGERTVEPFDGEPVSEREMARRLGVSYTPTIVFFDARGKELARHESYLEPQHFRSFLTFVTSGAREEFASFQDWIRARNSGRIPKD